MARMQMDMEVDGIEPEDRPHPQVKVFAAGAALMREARYIGTRFVEEDIAVLQALESVATELVFQLSRHGVMDQDAGRAAILVPIEQKIGTLQMLRDL